MKTAKPGLVLALGLFFPALADHARAQTTDARIAGTVNDAKDAGFAR
jgi:hypothetical protein